MKIARADSDRNEEEGLAKELDSMYRRVAGLEKQSGAGPADDLVEHYKTLKLDPSASTEDVRQAYIHLTGAWDPDRFTDHPEWKKRAEARLAEVNNAYETILTSRGREDKGDPGESSSVASEREAPAQEDGRKNTSRKTLIVALAAAAVVLFGIFIWPTLYHRDTITAGNKTYPLRMNRITGQMAFFDGGKWNLMPILRVEMFSPSDVLPPPDSPQTVSALPTQKALGTRTAENPVPQARPEGLQKAVPAVEKESTGKEISVWGQERPFAIQIRAIRDGDKAKAILNELKQGGLDGHLEAVAIKGQGTWYRIFVGRFATKEEALKHLNTGLLSSQYPGSFVQKIGPR